MGLPARWDWRNLGLQWWGRNALDRGQNSVSQILWPKWTRNNKTNKTIKQPLCGVVYSSAEPEGEAFHLKCKNAFDSNNVNTNRDGSENQLLSGRCETMPFSKYYFISSLQPHGMSFRKLKKQAYHAFNCSFTMVSWGL